MPAVYLRVFWRSIKEPQYRADLGQRTGRVDGIVPGAVWVHAVSAGETIAAKGLVECLLDAGHRVLVSNMTPAGRARSTAIFGDRVTNVYAPYDLPHATYRFLKRVKPSFGLTRLFRRESRACPFILPTVGCQSVRRLAIVESKSWLARCSRV